MGRRFGFKQENIFRLLVILVWTQTILMQYVRAVIMRFPVIGDYATEIITVLYITVALLALPSYKINRWDIIFLFSVTFVFLSEWAFYKDGSEYLNAYLIDFVVKILPLYIVGVSLSNSKEKEKIFRQLYILSVLTLIANIVYWYNFGPIMSLSDSKYQGDMNRAYSLLPHCCFIAYYAVKRTNVWNVLFTVISVFYLLMLGTRGAAMIYLICIVLLLIMGRTSKWALVRGVTISGVTVAFISSDWYDMFVLWMYHRAYQLGLSIRIFDKLMSETVSLSTGRESIKETLLMAAREKPIFGYGICSDRVITGSYAHNILIEMLVEYGVIVGLMLFVAIIIILFYGYISAKDEGEKGFIFSLICASFFKLFLSSSYLNESLLFLLLGMCVCCIRRKKRNEHKPLRSRVYHEKVKISYKTD